MSATTADPIDAAIPIVTGERWTPSAPGAPDRRFWIAFSAALTLHLGMLIGVASKAPRQVGEANGAEDAISVSMVTESELNSRSMAAADADLPPAQPAPTPPVETAQPPREPKPESKPESKAAEPPVPEAKPEQAKPAETAPEPKQTDSKTEDRSALRPTTAEAEAEKPSEKQPPAPETKPAEKSQGQDKVRATITEGLPDDALTIKEPAPKSQKQTQPKPPPKPPVPQPQKTAKLDLALPQPSLSQAPVTGGGRRASFERPPGITKSGANDDFARGVIRALQQTMPQLREVLGRVTVRITLNDNGNIVDVQVVRPSNLADVDQAVVFAARQTSYPLPPPNSVPADRSFVVTYIYK